MTSIGKVFEKFYVTVLTRAGAVVTKDLEDNGLYGGVPAKRIKEIENDVARL